VRVFVMGTEGYGFGYQYSYPCQTPTHVTGFAGIADY
jgi:hypothetical protein